MKIFLGSSREAVESGLIQKIAMWIETAGHTPLRWDDPEAFPTGVYTFTALQQIARQVDGAIFLFAEDDQVWYRTDKTTQPRDNVLIEYGIFSAALGEGRVIFCRSGRPRTATDLLGISHIDLAKNAMVRAGVMVTNWLRGLEATDLESLLLERLSSPFQASGKQSLFLKGTELISQACERVALVAKTPIFLIGPRPYDGSQTPVSYEAEQFSMYRQIATRAVNKGALDFISVASMSCMKEELAIDQPAALKARVKHNFLWLSDLVDEANGRIRLEWYTGAAPMTFLVSDDHFIIWLKDSSGESVWITAKNEVIARALYHQAQSIGMKMDRDHVLRELGLT